MELLLVLAVLVVLAAASLPALRGVMRDQALKAAADSIRTEWTRTHVRAMKTGRIHVFRYELGGSKYMVQPFIAGDDELEGATPAGGFDSAENPADLGFEKELPEGTHFAAGDALLESRSLSVEQQVQDATSFQGEWSRPILFYPDGSTSDAFVVIGNDREVGLRIDLRGMTGFASVGELASLEELTSE
jgi:type II secretory pathway pseudopilin PulG